MEIDIIIIGAGAAGLMAGITAARKEKRVLILEGNDKPAKKLLSTGNGRCNYTNKLMDSALYRGENPSFVLGALRTFDEEAAISFFKDIGIEPRSKNGYVYPRSMEARSVCGALINAAKASGVTIKCSNPVSAIKRDDTKFVVSADKDYISGRVIVAAGGKAAPSTGSDGNLFPVLENLGVKLIPPLPGLVPLVSKDSFLRGLSGVRCECLAEFFVGNKKKCESKGELQITDYGLSGIVIFDGSRYISVGLHNLEKCSITLDFLPEYPFDDAFELIRERFMCGAFFTAQDAISGLFNSKLSSAMLKASGIKNDEPCANVCEKKIKRLVDTIKAKSFDITGTKDFDRAQVTRGGVDTAFIDPDTMEHKSIPGLYFAGEVLDVDAVCGGYNLQWAWSSGYAAAKGASKSL